ncbi:hypothetical protein CAPN001_13410 [Capnocytophaga stomatis]|uniref:hypothetical protein n=1 Tax=Capnocytophaga stomatis TaxID=1848904 RepID=UPI00194FCA62|nr:hypothetical protein [Capnocytophaga stomatis]GIJ96772.1 hypothetical protein CAPN001_13410 [Capnocytophaga stomatis]
MEPMKLDEIPDEIFLEDIYDLTENIPKEFPTWLKQIEQQTGVKAEYIRFTDFVENVDDEESSEEFVGYFYAMPNQQMYRYSSENDILTIIPVDKKRLTMQDTFSLRVLHLLK